MRKRLLFCLMLITLALFLGACDQIDTTTIETDVSQITNAPFYTALQSTVLKVQIPVIIAGIVTLFAGWKFGRLGLAINGFIIGGLIIYTLLAMSEITLDDSMRTGAAIGGGIFIGLLAYFLYGLMALIIGGAIGMTLMNGAWLQFAQNLPPTVIAFIITFVSALVMFVVFRVFLVAFSAVVGAAILMLAVPFETLWVIPVAAVGIAVQSGIAWWIQDDIFKNIRGDLGAALSEAFGEVLGPFATLREHQKSEKEQPARQKSAKSTPEPRQEPKPQRSAPQQDYRPAQPPQPAPQNYSPVPPQRPASQQDYRPVPPSQPNYGQPQQPTPNYGASQQEYRPAQAPQRPAPQQDHRPAQSSQPSYGQAYQPPQPSSPIPPSVNPAPQAAPQAQPYPQTPPVFRPEDYQLMVSNGQSIPLVGSQMTLGRNPDNQIVINDPEISSYHLIFSIQPDGVVVWDNNSTNGTLLNGMLLTGWHRLTTSDILQIGPVTVRLLKRQGA